jgi:hypothetical protein
LMSKQCFKIILGKKNWIYGIFMGIYDKNIYKTENLRVIFIGF